LFNDNIVIVDAVRTPIGKFGGVLKNINSGFLATHVIEKIIERNFLDSDKVDEVILGEVRQSSLSSNVARVAALRAGIPASKPAFTVNRLCASSMQAIASGVQQIQSGQADIIIAGGTENMSQAPVYLREARFSSSIPQVVDSNTENGQQPMEIYSDLLGMGITAENLAEKYNISRVEQDEFALSSQRKAEKALQNNIFNNEIVPIKIKEKKSSFIFSEDEHPRKDTSIEKLLKLKPVFKSQGSVTAGNSSGRNDGASALLIMSEKKAKELNLIPLAKILDWTAVGVDPEYMGIGPVPAIKRLLQRTDKDINQFGLVELNEAFAAQTLAVLREINIPEERLNVNGGAISLGHPLGMTGARITTSLIHEMIRRKEKYGLATLCVGGGQGMAMALELM